MSAVWLVVLLMILPIVYVVVKKQRAAASLDRLLTSHFGAKVVPPVQRLGVPRGGELLFHTGYASTLASGEPFVLLLGNWRRSRSAFLRIAGAYLPRSPGGPWLERAARSDVLVAAAYGAGAVIAWPDLASGPSVTANLDRLATSLRSSA